jgi:hypothetical protein
MHSKVSSSLVLDEPRHPEGLDSSCPPRHIFAGPRFNDPSKLRTPPTVACDRPVKAAGRSTPWIRINAVCGNIGLVERGTRHL